MEVTLRYGKRSMRIAIPREADLKLVIGNIDPHQFAGFTAGAKGVVIGCGSMETIEANHAMMLDENARVGGIEDNPVRSDLDEAGRLIGIDMAINTVIDSLYRVIRILAGDPAAVYKEGSKACAGLYGISLEKRFDIVVASCGGHPKDITLYQAQKGLAHASAAAKPGGKILLMAACEQGVGDEEYPPYVSRFSMPEEVIEDFACNGFRIRAHKAFLFSRTLSSFEVVLATDLDADTLSRCHLRSDEPQATLDRWVKDFRGRPSVAVIPAANTTYFYPLSPSRLSSGAAPDGASAR